MRNLFFAILILSIFMCINDSFGADYHLYTETGGMGIIERGISEGHKSYHLLGIEGIEENLSHEFKFGMEGFFRGEPADEDPEILQNGIALKARYKVKLFAINPYLGVSANYWSRDENMKYDDSVDHFYFLAASGGVEYTNDWFYADLGTIIPFWVNTQSGNFGIDSAIGFKYKNWNLGYHYKKVILSNHHFQYSDNGFEFNFSGVELGYRF